MSAEYLQGVRAAVNDLTSGNVGDPEMGARNPHDGQHFDLERYKDWESGYNTTVAKQTSCIVF